MMRWVISTVLLLMLVAPGCTGLDEGLAAAKRGDYATALREFRPLAEQGNAQAQYYIGFMYRKGRGVPQDDAEAAKWYRKAAAQGNAEAQNNLGGMYRKGRGVPQDYAEAVKWYRKAAGHHNPSDVRANARLRPPPHGLWRGHGRFTQAATKSAGEAQRRHCVFRPGPRRRR